jgi:hypothetical protein
LAHRVHSVAGRKGMARFIDVPFRLFDRTRHPHWTPPLRAAMRDLLDPGRDPFYRNAAIQMFVAEEGGRPVGRVAAIENRSHNRHHGDRTGFFGFFECGDDQAVAAGLLAAAEEWLRARGLAVARGPVSPSMNHECGLLVDGCGGDTMVFTPWNPPYYDALVTAAGYDKAKDLLAFDFPMGAGFQVPGRIARVAGRMRDRTGMTFRDVDFKHFADEIPTVWPLYVQAWSGNWGFVPPDLDEFTWLAKSLKPLMVPGFCYVAEMGGEAVGFMIIVRDFNKIFQKIPSGRLGPVALWHLLVGSRRVMRGRIILLGLKEEVRKGGLFPLLAHEAMRRGAAVGAERAEGSWVLEDNEALTAPLRSMGLEEVRRWRIYDKTLGPVDPTR